MTCPKYIQGLSEEEEQKIKELEQMVADEAHASPSSQHFCSKATYVRYLRARSWNVARAAKMLRETLKWRASFKPEQLAWDNIKHEGARGKLFVLEEPDLEGRPVVLMRPRNEDKYSGDSDERIKWLVYTLEQASRMADETSPDGKMAWLVDFVGYTRANSPPIKVSIQTLHILQNHYPERLGRAVSYQPPFIFEITWKAVSPFIDPVTHKKLAFLNKNDPVEKMAEFFNLDHIDDSFGGGIPIDQLWDFDAYGEKMKEWDAQYSAQLQKIN